MYCPTPYPPLVCHLPLKLVSEHQTATSGPTTFLHSKSHVSEINFVSIPGSSTPACLPACLPLYLSASLPACRNVHAEEALPGCQELAGENGGDYLDFRRVVVKGASGGHLVEG